MRALAPAAAALGLTVAVFTRFLAWAEARPGVPLADPVLARLPAVDVSAWVFLVLVQHAHYAVDVLAAPPCAWLAWRAGRALPAATA